MDDNSIFNNNLHVLQIIKTVQGEGDTLGCPSILIRLAGCNCRCPFCDTKWSWDVNKDAIIYNQLNINYLINEITTLANNNIRNLIITGGEPLLYKNNPIFHKILQIDEFETIEIETNGSLIDEEFLSLLTSFDNNNIKLNISPKLNESWYLNNFNVTHLDLISNLNNIYNYYNYIFKFVDDDRELIEMFIAHGVYYDKIYLMPLTPNRFQYEPDQFNKLVKQSSLRTLQYCLDNGYNFVPRLHLYLFDDETENIK